MAEYIEREAAISYIKENQCKHCSDIGLCGNCAVLTAIKLFESISAADVQPVKHGRWIDKNPQDKYDPRCICSVCGSVEFPLSRHKYCPNCGAKMDGET